MTVLEVIQRSSEYLAKRGVDSPRLQIELLLAHVLGMPRLQLYLNFERTLPEIELAALRELVKRRANREPLQHLVGSVSFCGLELKVTPAVLIPRPETELLAERAWSCLNQLAKPDQGAPPPTVLDFGTGSGCLAIAVAVKCPHARVWALDVSDAALAVARTNAASHGVEARIQFLAGDGLAPWPPETRCDLLVANPPYIPSLEILELEPEVRDHDPRLALDGGADGLTFMRLLAADGPRVVAHGGCLMLEFGDGQAEAVRALFQQAGWRDLAVECDIANRPRILIARNGAQ